MIQTEGGFFLQLDIGSIKDFITRPEDLLEFTIVESCGGNLPEFILSFLSSNESILALLHEGTPINATYGEDRSSLDNVKCYTGKLSVQKEGEADRSYSINGLCVDQTYITDNTLQMTGKTSGVEAALAVIKQTFTVDTNITKSLDSQVWIQPSTTDKAFVSKTLMHSDFGTSFPIMSITANGTFILRDAVKLIQGTTPKWRFVSQQQAITDIEFLADGAIESNTTFTNNWTGYQKITKVLNIIKDTVSDISTAFKPLLAISSLPEAMTGVNYRFKGFKAQSDNVHANYWASADRTLVYQTQMSKIEVIHSIRDKYYKIKPLDLAFVKEYGKDSSISSDYTSGLYLVSTVSRSIQGKTFITTLGFNRESMNNVKNVGG